ncbi:hypothetical protein [Psychrobacter sp. DAB_AL43B]|uniref:hypothetical protein n=1 Tax=Psychrobacter sp. DAB_AL43B TaxID=1028416 RepID=UPI0009A80234|nr:hypothetical protein [Psychrobacter sp. DAB_AL43B]SLJ84717.1 hypothetical protein DABAL43B_1522 [Psychrobacter sp. DAB_AL43B]
MAKSSKPANGQGKTKTKLIAESKIVTLKPSVERNYLCAHICFAEKFPRFSKAGAKLKQRACTLAIWAEEEANHLIWRYKAEVGYAMDRIPPMPIMSPKKGEELRPSRFPLGRASGMGLFVKKDYEDSAKGRLRIPDCVVLKITDAELIKLRMSGAGNFKNLVPIQSNIAKIVEIKFGQDVLSDGQIKAYRKIAGDDNNFNKLRDTDCRCQLRNPQKYGAQTKEYTYLKNPWAQVAVKHESPLTHGTIKPSNQPISDYLDNPVVTNIVIGSIVVATVAVGIFLAPEIVAGALILRIATS